MSKKKSFPWKTILADLAVVGSLVPVILPQLTDAPAWLRTSLTIFALVVARLNGTRPRMPGDVVDDSGSSSPGAGGAVVLLFAAALGLASSGCGAGWQSGARDTLGLASRGVVFADRAVDAEAHAVCPDAGADCLHARGFDIAHDAIAAAKSAINAGEIALLHALDTGVEAVWRAAAPCIGAAVAAVLQAITDARVDIPAWVNDTAALVVAILGPCVAPPASPSSASPAPP